jgi:hypothetical protein
MKLKCIPAPLLGAVHRSIRMAQEIVDFVIVGRIDGNSDTDSD